MAATHAGRAGHRRRRRRRRNPTTQGQPSRVFGLAPYPWSSPIALPISRCDDSRPCGGTRLGRDPVHGPPPWPTHKDIAFARHCGSHEPPCCLAQCAARTTSLASATGEPDGQVVHVLDMYLPARPEARRPRGSLAMSIRQRRRRDGRQGKIVTVLAWAAGGLFAGARCCHGGRVWSGVYDSVYSG